MRYYELICMLQKDYDISCKDDNHSSKVMDIKYIENQVDHWNTSTLYVSTDPSLTQELEQPIMLLCSYQPDTLPKGSRCSIFKKEDLHSLLNTAKEYILEELRADAALFELAEAVLYGKSIVQIINTAASLMENALILVDNSMKVLAHSTIYDITDPLWAENVERGTCSYEFMQKVRADKRMKEWSKQDGETQVIQLPGDLQPKLVARMTYGGHFIGSLVMIENESPIRRYHHRQLPRIGKILIERLNYHALGGVRSAILYDLLDKADISDTLKLIEMSKASFPKEMYVVVARFVRPINNRYLKRTIGMDLERIFTKGYSVQYKSYIAILVASVSASQKEELTKIAQSEDVSIGLSWSFNDILEFKRHFNQAVSSIKFAQRFNLEKQIFDYTHFSHYDLLYNYTGKLPLQNYCHPALQALREYDESNNTQLYDTLKTYLNCNKNLRATSEALFIHRNSLAYRLSRIHQVTELDFNNVNTIDSLKDSYRIERFLQAMIAG